MIMKLPVAVRHAVGLAVCLVGSAFSVAQAETIRVEVNQAEIIRLEADAQIVHIANPAIADVVVESPRLLFVLGRAPGQTGLFILDANGKEVINADLLVTPNNNHEVTLNRNAVELTYSCSPRCVVTNVPELAAAGAGAATAAPTGATPTASVVSGTGGDAATETTDADAAN